MTITQLIEHISFITAKLCTWIPSTLVASRSKILGITFHRWLVRLALFFLLQFSIFMRSSVSGPSDHGGTVVVRSSNDVNKGVSSSSKSQLKVSILANTQASNLTDYPTSGFIGSAITIPRRSTWLHLWIASNNPPTSFPAKRGYFVILIGGSVRAS